MTSLHYSLYSPPYPKDPIECWTTEVQQDEYEFGLFKQEAGAIRIWNETSQWIVAQVDARYSCKFPNSWEFIAFAGDDKVGRLECSLEDRILKIEELRNDAIDPHLQKAISGFIPYKYVGYGLIHFSFQYLKGEYDHVNLLSRSNAESFYEKLGFTAVPEPKNCGPSTDCLSEALHILPEPWEVWEKRLSEEDFSGVSCWSRCQCLRETAEKMQSLIVSAESA